MGSRGTHGIPFLAVELLAVNGYWAPLGEDLSFFFFRAVMVHTPVNGTTVIGMVGILI